LNFLELGCANGELSRILYKRYGLSGLGVDLNTPEQQSGEGVLFLRQSINEYLETSTEFFDIVILSHTLEHLLNPLFTLELIKERLRVDGYIIIVVPNAVSTRTKAWGYWQVPVHISHFDESSLKTLLNRSGFVPIHVANASLDFLGMGLTILNLFKTKKSPKQSKFLTLLTPFFALCWSVFYKLGNSDLILVAKNSDEPRHPKSEG
jgi:SAM-dependent methyltransferase